MMLQNSQPLAVAAADGFSQADPVVLYDGKGAKMLIDGILAGIREWRSKGATS